MDADVFEKVIKEAIDGEIEAKIFYLDISTNIKDDHLTELFLGFSKEEEGHEKMLSTLLEKGKTHAPAFGSRKEYKVSESYELPAVSLDMNLKDAIGLAMKNEEIAMKKYQALADDCDDLELKSVFNSLANMEKDHKAKMETAFVDVAYPEVW